jgi:hypothetical protein
LNQLAYETVDVKPGTQATGSDHCDLLATNGRSGLILSYMHRCAGRIFIMLSPFLAIKFANEYHMRSQVASKNHARACDLGPVIQQDAAQGLLAGVAQALGELNELLTGNLPHELAGTAVYDPHHHPVGILVYRDV